MISEEFAYAVCKDDIRLIENYDNALADKTQTWVCHHKKGIDIPKPELIRLGLYYHQPSSDLIFLTKKEHNQVHKKILFGNSKSKSERSKEMWQKRKEKGWAFSDEALQKMSKAKKGKNPWNKGKETGPRSEETKKKISEKMKGGNSTSWKKGQAAWNKGMPGHTKGKKHYTNGVVNIFAYECPAGFREGWIKKNG